MLVSFLFLTDLSHRNWAAAWRVLFILFYVFLTSEAFIAFIVIQYTEQVIWYV